MLVLESIEELNLDSYNNISEAIVKQYGEKKNVRVIKYDNICVLQEMKDGDKWEDFKSLILVNNRII